MAHTIKFGTSGWRAVMAEDFTFANVRRALHGIARYVTSQKAAGARVIVGSVTIADDLRRRMIAQTQFKLHPRGVAGFAPLAAAAGFRVVKAAPAFLSEQVLLRPV